ncbi:uncharacterized protein LOC103708409 [Phoenix dactylifera]|uniref:Uncharacterized protein LOC103708409 n=1 Tax=Phoenix dactylifera TaxID=42345 RepID=A0A8B7C4E1_PHODC|nr:uncharacterized protein LOC103708409 [Phoenix dactylifera]
MAGRREHAYRFFTPVTGPESTWLGSDEFDEADVWGCALEPRPAEHHKPVTAATWSERKKTVKRDRVTAEPASLPMGIPDWSKILREEYRGSNSHSNSGRDLEDDDDDDDEGVGSGPVIPPHELLWRNRVASFSVHEGIGRTLKGRDLSRLRNAVWEKVGFQD